MNRLTRPRTSPRYSRGVLAARFSALMAITMIVVMVFLTACMPARHFTGAVSDFVISRYVTVELDGRPIGSGVMYDRKHVITNAHVAGAAKRIIDNAAEGETPHVIVLTVKRLGKSFAAKVLVVNDLSDKGVADLALIVTDVGEDLAPLQIRAEGIPVRTPLMIVSSLVTMPHTLVLEASVVNVAANVWSYLVQAHVWPGMSGSPVFDEQGRLAGLVYAMYFGTWSTMGERHNAGIAGIVGAAQIIELLEDAGILSPDQPDLRVAGAV